MPWIAPVIVSPPVDPLTVIVSVPDAQVLNVHPDRSSEPFAETLTAMAWVEAVPVTASVVAILPAPNCAPLNVAVDVPDVFTKASASTLTKPSTPLFAAELRSILVPAPATPICTMSLPAPPS